MFHNSDMFQSILIKIDQNMSELWDIMCKNIIWTLVRLLVLLYETESSNWGSNPHVSGRTD